LPERDVVDERRVLAFDDQIARDALETHGPIVRLDGMATPSVGVQVVDDIAAARVPRCDSWRDDYALNGKLTDIDGANTLRPT
jgi:hypothetical protein